MVYNASDHPRSPKGTPTGGQFTVKPGVGVDDDLAEIDKTQEYEAMFMHSLAKAKAQFRDRVDQLSRDTGTPVDQLLEDNSYKIQLFRNGLYVNAIDEIVDNVFVGRCDTDKKTYITGHFERIRKWRDTPKKLYYEQDYNPFTTGDVQVRVYMFRDDEDGNSLARMGFIFEPNGKCTDIRGYREHGRISGVSRRSVDVDTMRTHAAKELLEFLEHGGSIYRLDEALSH